MNEIDFTHLNGDKNFAFLDISSISTLALHQDILSNDIRNLAQYTEIKKRLTKSQSAKTALEIMSRLVAYDSLVIDKVGIESASSPIPEDILNLVQVTTIPKSVYSQAGKDVDKIIDTQSIYKAEKEVAQTINIGAGDYEGYFDNIFKLSVQASTIADTGTTIPRVLFYMFLGNACQAPIFLSPSKDPLLSYVLDNGLSSTDVKDLLSMVETSANKEIITLLNKFVHRTVSMPPLAQYVLGMARREKISIIQAMLEIKNSKDAKAFRQWRHEIHKDCVLDTTASLIRANKQWDELDHIVKVWADNANIGLGVTHKYATFGLSLLTSTLENIGIKIDIPKFSFSVKDPIVNPRKELRFISSWYKR
ncbi:MAG: hypothetical protein WBC60_11315 [Cognaticolwellia sp.]